MALKRKIIRLYSWKGVLMIYVRLEGYDFKYEIHDVLRLFFSEKEIIYIDIEPPSGYEGAFFLCSVTDSESGLLLEINLSDGEYSYNERLPAGEAPAGEKKLENLTEIYLEALKTELLAVSRILMNKAFKIQSIYNIQIMEERQTIIAVGAGATTKVVYPEDNRIERAFNVKDVEEYIRRVNQMVERKITLL